MAVLLWRTHLSPHSVVSTRNCTYVDMQFPTNFQFPKPEIKESMAPNHWTVQLDHNFLGKIRYTAQNALPK